MRAVLVGNYGVGNFGDEALRAYFVTTFPQVQWSVVSARPGRDDIPRLPVGLRSFLSTPWWQTIRVIKRSDMLVFGGGTLFTDIESVRACVLWGLHALVARMLGVRIVLAFQGIGPFRSRLGEWIARRVVAWCICTSVRDGASMARVAAWRSPQPVIETFDPVFLAFLRHVRPPSVERVWTVIPRHNSGEAFDRAVQDMLQARRPRSMEVLLFQPDDPRERAVGERLRRLLPGVALRPVSTIDHVMEAMGRSERCVSERFHGALAALAAGVPLTVVSQGEGDKLSQVRSLVGDPTRIAAAKNAAERGEKRLLKLFEGFNSC